MTEKHVHMYGLVKVGKVKQTKVLSCHDPKCNHYLPNHLLDLAIGKASICWLCKKEFILKKTDFKKKPTCTDCKNKVRNPGKEADKADNESTDNIMKALGIEIPETGEEDGTDS